MTRDLRYVRTELRAGQSQGDEGALVVSGRALSYNKLSELHVPMQGCREKLAPGCFTESLRSGRDILADYNHERSSLPLGRSSNGSLSLSDGPQGLDFSLRLNKSIGFHRDLHEAVRAGLVHECSFGFTADKDEWNDELEPSDDTDRSYTPVRTVRKARLFGISLVDVPAYGDGATHAQARSLSYALAAARPILTSAAIRKELAAILVQIRDDEAAYPPAEGRASLERQIEQNRIDCLREQIAAEEQNPSCVLDTDQRIYVPKLDLLRKQLSILERYL